MSFFEWTVAILLGSFMIVGITSWMAHLSFMVGKVIAELHAIGEKLCGQLEWIKSLDEKSDDHERRIMKLEDRR